MNLVIIAALIAVCGAAKLDRTYLPPASAKTAGGSPGSLQTPFAGNSLNNGLGGLPKGSYENDFQGVVVDAAAAGTRASESGESGLGASRISYGSTNSKVGAAAFKTRPSAFAPAQSNEQTEVGDQGFQAAQGSFSSGAADFQQGAFSSEDASNSAFQQQSQQSFSNSDRPRASLDRSASILRYENEVGPESYHYAFETDNGISAEENGVATNGVQAQGGFSYTGDDGQVYSVSYTADENGYQPKGDHLPTPPPIPEEILKSLEQNARDEAAGLSDDGSYDAQRYNAGSDYAESGDSNGKFTHQSSTFGGAEADAGTFNQNQGSRRPVAGQSSFNSQAGQGSNLNGQNSNRYTQGGFGSDSNGASNGQSFNAQSGQTSNGVSGQSDQSGIELADEESTTGQLEQSNTGSQSQTNGFGSFAGVSTQSGSKQSQSRPSLGNRNEYLPPLNRPNGRPQNGRPQNGKVQGGRPQALLNRPDLSKPSQEVSDDEDSSADAVPLGQQDLQDESRPQQALNSFGKPISNGVSSQNGLGSSNNQIRPSNGRRPASNANNFAQGQSSQTGRPNEYLPPTGSSSNRRPSNRPQQPNKFSSQYNQQNLESNADSDVQPQDQTQNFPASSSIGSQSQLNSFQTPQSARPGQNGNRFPSQGQTSLNSASAQSTFGFSSQKATAQPATELTTPFETSNDESDNQSNGNVFTSGGRPTQASFANNGQNGFSSQSANRPQGSRPQNPRPFGQAQAPAFPTQSSGQFNQNAQLVSQPQSQNSYDQNDDAQYSSSTPRPSFTQQSQGPDDSYYYNQPSRPFGTPQASRFPSAPSNQFNRVTQQSSLSQSQLSNSPQDIPSTAVPSNQGSAKYPRPPVISPTSPTSQIQGQFGNNYRKPSSTRQPRPPVIAPTTPTGSAQYQGNNLNGVTQASIAPFPSQIPTQASQGQFGSRPSYQQTQYKQESQSASSSFAQKPTQPSFSQQSTASASFSRRPSTSTSFQSQAQTIGQQSENQDQTSNDETVQPVSSQQYTGEIYEYNKPAMTLPPPDSTPASPTTQFGQKMPSKGQFGKPQSQFGLTIDDDDQRPPSPIRGQTSTAQGSRPQFGAQSKPQPFGVQSKPQFGQSLGAQAQTTDEDMTPFGALAQSQAMFGSQSSKPARPQFGQSRPQFGQTQSTFGQSESTQESLDDKPESESEPSSAEPQGPKNQFGFVSACCRDNDSRKPAKNQFEGQSLSQTSFTGSQKQPTSSFAGKGEEFGGPRPPPSFDEETGYHY